MIVYLLSFSSFPIVIPQIICYTAQWKIMNGGSHMKSIREIYKIGKGPSSSHTMGPERAALQFLKEYPDAARYQVILYGSLNKTGIGHGTDSVLRASRLGAWFLPGSI